MKELILASPVYLKTVKRFKMLIKFSLVLFFFNLFFNLGCVNLTAQSKKTTVLDVSQEDDVGGTGMSSTDIRAMAEKMAREIASLHLKKDEPKIALVSIINQSRFSFDTDLLKNRLLADLVIISQKDHRVSFTMDPSKADYLLDASVTSLSKGSIEAVSDYLLYTFKLIDNTDNIIWMGTYETKKQGNVGVMYR